MAMIRSIYRNAVVREVAREVALSVLKVVERRLK